MIRRRRRSEDIKLDTILDQDVRFRGELTGKANVIIRGRMKGNVTVEGSLLIAPSARIKGDVRAKVIIVAGVLNGNLHAIKKLELRTTGKIQGDVRTPLAALAYGSLLRGEIKSREGFSSRILHFREKRKFSPLFHSSAA